MAIGPQHFPAIQTVLENNRVVLYPLQEGDFEDLYRAACDPEVWEQHPNKDRWKRDVFLSFFKGAMQSKGAYKIVEKASGKIIGSTRFYDYDEQENRILIGYTFYAKAYWGKGVNLSVKGMMLAHIFQFVRAVDFHIGAGNIRSQVAIGRLGAAKVGEMQVPYFDERPVLNYIYRIERAEFLSR